VCVNDFCQSTFGSYHFFSDRRNDRLDNTPLVYFLPLQALLKVCVKIRIHTSCDGQGDAVEGGPSCKPEIVYHSLYLTFPLYSIICLNFKLTRVSTFFILTIINVMGKKRTLQLGYGEAM
jgi:hypothetical protein